MRGAKNSGAVNVDHDGEKGKGIFEAKCSLKHMHFGLWRAAATKVKVLWLVKFLGQFQAHNRNLPVEYQVEPAYTRADRVPC
jgi:hypothetical protein